MNIMNFPTAEQFDIQNALLASIASNSGGIPIASWADVQRINRMGLGNKVFTEGDQFMATVQGVPHVWNLIGIDKDTPADPRFKYSLTIQPEMCLMNAQLSAPQAMYHAVAELPEGTYIFTTNGAQYQVTITQPIPAGGIMYIATRADYVPLTINTYDIDRVTLIESGLVVTPATGTDTLTPINDYVRMRYGSNEYISSAVRQYMNSDEDTFTWVPQGLYDMPSSYTTEGFLKLLDPELLAVLGSVTKKVARNNVTDGGGQDTFTDKVFLLSRMELGYGAEGDVAGEFVYPFYDGVTNAERIKILGTSPRTWWVRSPGVSGTNSTRYVSTSGALSYGGASNSVGLAPACVII